MQLFLLLNWIQQKKKLTNPNRCRKSEKRVSGEKKMKLPKKRTNKGEFEEVFIENNGVPSEKVWREVATEREPEWKAHFKRVCNLKMQTEHTVKRKLRIHSICLLHDGPAVLIRHCLFAFGRFVRFSRFVRFRRLSVYSIVAVTIRWFGSRVTQSATSAAVEEAVRQEI